MATLPSRRYSRLCKRLANLERIFLPAIDLLGNYTADQYDHVRAYIVLCHAEIESYIEYMCLDLLEKAEERWKSKGKSSLCMAALMLYNERKVVAPKSLSKQVSADLFDAVVKKAFKLHREYLQRDNHGIKEANLMKMLLPLGFQEAEFDNVWLADMNSFGVMRGLVAHQSAQVVQNPPDPALAKQRVESVLAGVAKIESVFVRLRRN
ncbi:HEPN domain-containing protein [Nonomuraea indica]|uniref:HEPN domain-containing protein n=1 Tax=Nonomuraea indica TaxID=1581193 RepID=UPI001183A128|nr:HEPN domain-containing protein [Nonomuraea indica]